MVIKKTSTDYDLIEMFGDEHESFAREAFIEFHKRHASFIFNCCYDFVKDSKYIKDAKSEAKDLSQLVLNKILRGSSTFKRKKNIASDEIVFHVRGWVYRIIENAFNDEYIKKMKSRPELVRVEVERQDKAEFDYLKSLQETKTKELSKDNQGKYKMIMEAMSKVSMSFIEEDVLRVYLESGWFDERNNWNLPPERMEELIKKHEVNRNSIIKCKSRLMLKIKNKL